MIDNPHFLVICYFSLQHYVHAITLFIFLIDWVSLEREQQEIK